MNSSNNSFYDDKYNLAYKKLKSIFDFIYEEYNLKNDVNPIEHIKYRIKKPNSIKQKLFKRNITNLDMLYDIVGVRIVCCFLSDLEIIKNVVKELARSGVLVIDNEKDYIKNPKEDSGYSSYHMQIKVPINYNNNIEYVNAEIQIRTIAMDMSASLEHKLCYKKDDCSTGLKAATKMATNFCSEIDADLDNVSRFVNSNEVRKNDVNYSFMYGEEYELFIFEYREALKVVKEKLGDLYNYYDNSDRDNPIEHIKSRIKRNDRIVRKLELKNKDICIDNMRSHVKDIAGARIVCSFLSDLEELKQIIINDKDFIIIDEGEKDYVSSPKESGYRGYHILVGVPVYTLRGIKYVPVEIQIRTIAMEMWASLEEKICYHKNSSLEISNELKRVSDNLDYFDNEIDNIRNKSKKDYVKRRVMDLGVK